MSNDTLTAWLWITDADGDTRQIGQGTAEWCNWTAQHLDASLRVTDAWYTLTPDANAHRFDIYDTED